MAKRSTNLSSYGPKDRRRAGSDVRSLMKWVGMTDEEIHIAALRTAWYVADEAWQAELVRLFGANAGDVRYTERGRTGPTLTPLYEAFRAAAKAYDEARQ